jgi:hypothetical protein
MTDVCREFGISRKTRYKSSNGYREHGCEAFQRSLAATDACAVSPVID